MTFALAWAERGEGQNPLLEKDRWPEELIEAVKKA
jgi:hypothetical protein